MLKLWIADKVIDAVGTENDHILERDAIEVAQKNNLLRLRLWMQRTIAKIMKEYHVLHWNTCKTIIFANHQTFDIHISSN